MIEPILKEERGEALTEYMVLVGFVAVALIGVLTSIGTSLREKTCETAQMVKTGYDGRDHNRDGRNNQRMDFYMHWNMGGHGSDLNDEDRDYNCDGEYNGVDDELFEQWTPSGVELRRPARS